MEGSAYIAALLRLCRHSSEAVIRRALKLITTSVAKLSLQEQPDTKVTCCLPAAVMMHFCRVQHSMGLIVSAMLLMYCEFLKSSQQWTTVHQQHSVDYIQPRLY